MLDRDTINIITLSKIYYRNIEAEAAYPIADLEVDIATCSTIDSEADRKVLERERQDMC